MTKILVAEDDRFLASAYKAKLTKAGYEVQLASDGEEAILILKDFTPDLILLDLVMPKKDGFSVLEEVHANAAWQKIPVIVASNLGQSEDIERARGLGAVDFIIKSDMPLGMIVEKIEKVLKP